MSLFDRKRAGLVAVALSCLVMAGCTLAPVHGGSSGVNALNLTYAEPLTRPEQLFYRHISSRFAPSTAVETGELSASIRISSSRIGLASVSSPVGDHQLTATATYRVVREGQPLASGSRSATANYQTTGQIVGDDAARANAEEQAVRAVAEQVRLVLLGELTER